MPIGPRDENATLAKTGELAKTLARFGNRASHCAFADIARARAPQILERKDTVVAVIPHDADRITANFLERFDYRSL